MPSHTLIVNDDITFKPGLWSAEKVAFLYDLAVIHGTYPLLWKCPWTRPARLYRRALKPGMTVVDVGPASGFFLDLLGPRTLTLHLVDRYEGALAAAAHRLARYRPTAHQHDALDGPFPVAPASADLVILGMVLHCLRGESIADKESVFERINDVLKPNGEGEFIGYTVLAKGVRHGLLGHLGLRFLNARGVFANSGDSLTDTVAALSARFDILDLSVCGSVLMWRVRTR
jgi:SAM-dependent methyltransferase